MVTSLFSSAAAAQSQLCYAMLLCRELKQRIKPEVIELIKQQRLNHLVNGTRFSIKLGRRSGQPIHSLLS